MSSEPAHRSRSSRVLGLDSIRIVLATWVVLGHVGFVPIDIPKTTLVGLVASGLYHSLFNGPAAVIVFFVISGFCIHYPFRQSQPKVVPYYSRRYVRILTPMIVAIWLSELGGTRLSLFHASILWSLLCEEIYYALYPALAWAGRRIGWKGLIAIATALAYALVALSPHGEDYPSYGPFLNWVLGLPCWLLGCLLAETAEGLEGVPRPVWRWRAGALVISMALLLLKFHTPITYPWTLNVFAFYAAAWLRCEIATYRTRSPSTLLEWGGKWSYSLYLMHVPVLMFTARLPLRERTMSAWAIRLVLVYSACYLFYLLIEKPSHAAARRLGERLAHRARPPLAPGAGAESGDGTAPRTLQLGE